MDANTARSADGYRARAEQIRAEADSMKNPESKLALLHIATSYEHLADRLSWGHAKN